MAGTLQRIKEFIDFEGINISAFEKKVGFSNGSYASQLKNNKTIGIDKLENILNIYPDINSEWLLTGQGTMLKSTTTPPILTSQPEVPNNDQLKIIAQLTTQITTQKDTIINLQGLVISLQQQLATAKSVIPANPITVKPKENPAGKELVT